MTDANTFFIDFTRGIAATAPQAEEDEAIEWHSVLSRDPLGAFLPPQLRPEPSRPVLRPVDSKQVALANCMAATVEFSEAA